MHVSGPSVSRNNTRTIVNIILKAWLHYQLDRRKSAIQKIYDGLGNFNDGSVDSVARLLRRLRWLILTKRPSYNSNDSTVVKLQRPS